MLRPLVVIKKSNLHLLIDINYENVFIYKNKILKWYEIRWLKKKQTTTKPDFIRLHIIQNDTIILKANVLDAHILAHT